MTLMDEFTRRLFREAEDTLKEEPELEMLLSRTVLAKDVESFEDAVASTVCYRLLLHPPCNRKDIVGGDNPSDSMFCPNMLNLLLRRAFANESILEAGYTMKESVRQDAKAVIDRDPACNSLLEVVLFFKGFAALVCHRAARQKWISSKSGRSMTALFLQSQASAMFSVDIHPGATIGAGIMLDHGTGVVIGETAKVGDGCTFLHGVTLGGTGKDHGDRHPKVGTKVLIGAGASVLGCINIGSRSKIGAGSIVLRDIPPGATAVGAPAKIIGRALEDDPASGKDDLLENVGLLHKSPSCNDTEVISSVSAGTITTLSDDDEDTSSGMCPYRKYTQLAQAAPTNALTLCKFAKVMKERGCCNMNEIGSSFFALDKRNVGYLHRNEIDEGDFAAILKENTSFEYHDINDIFQIIVRDNSS